MGLAPYGEPEFADAIRKMIRPVGDGFALNLDYFTHHRKGVSMSWNDGAPVVEPFFSDLLEKELGRRRQPDEPMSPRHDNLAKSLQVVTEEILMHLLNRLHGKTQCPNVCMTGGVAMNSVANGKITTQTPFENVYIPAGAADNGTAFGAAFYVWNRVLKQSRGIVQDHGYLGSESTSDACAEALREVGLPFETFAKDDRWEGGGRVPGTDGVRRSCVRESFADCRSPSYGHA